MASTNFIIILAIIAIASPSLVAATDYIVGDDSGWTGKFDYVAWTKDKMFMVGDNLVFKYNASAHNVYKVNGTDFQSCTVPAANVALDTGNDVITLKTSGKKWYICGKPNHCSKLGMKLVIDVMEGMSVPAPAPSSAPDMLPSWYQVLAAGVIGTVAMVVA